MYIEKLFNASRTLPRGAHTNVGCREEFGHRHGCLRGHGIITHVYMYIMYVG